MKLLIIPALILLSLIVIKLFGLDQPIETKEEWCEVGTVNKDGSVSFTGESNEEVVVFATVNGPKVMTKCTTQQ